jgi:hypothetical protein
VHQNNSESRETNIPTKPQAVISSSLVEEIVVDADFDAVLENPQNYEVVIPCVTCNSTANTVNENMICELCQTKRNIIEHRVGASLGLKRQAEVMFNKSNKKFRTCEIGQNVLVNIPEVDRSKASPRNVLAVVMQQNSNQLYTLATRDGVLDKQYSRNEFEVADNNFLMSSDLNTEATISLRAAAASACNSKQGFVMCNCRKGCKSNQCKCKRRNLLCNSRCHNSLSCNNK